MRDHNYISMIGRLANSPEMRHTSDGTAVVHFRIANNRGQKDGEKVDANFFNCQAWGRVADVIVENLEKGMKIFIEGYLSYERWQDRTGAPKSSVKITIHHITFLEKKHVDPNG